MVFLYWWGVYLVSKPRNHCYIVLFCSCCGSSGRFPQLRHAVRVKRHIHAASRLPASCESQILDPLEVSQVSERWSEDKFANLWWGVAVGSWLPGHCYNFLPSNSGSLTVGTAIRQLTGSPKHILPIMFVVISALHTDRAEGRRATQLKYYGCSTTGQAADLSQAVRFAVTLRIPDVEDLTGRGSERSRRDPIMRWGHAGSRES